MTSSKTYDAKSAFLAFLTIYSITTLPAYSDPLTQALSKGSYILQFRPRYEFVQQPGLDEAQAFTIRTMLALSSHQEYGLIGYVQFINVSSLLNHYNSLLNGKTQYSIIPDPEETGVNQFYIQYTGWRGIKARVGRQEIVLNDRRFVGNANFFQTPQSFDAVSLHYSVDKHIRLFGAYIWRIKNILNQLEASKTFLAQASFVPNTFLHADFFGYWYGNQSKTMIPGAAACLLPGVQACNDQIIGIRVAGNIPLTRSYRIQYDGSYAKQLPYDRGSPLVNSSYVHGGVGLSWRNLGIHADYMVMGANKNGTYGFQTPLATKHLFNGWADVFLTTPKEGLKSLYFTAKAQWMNTKFLARYYSFDSSYHSMYYGHEVDLSAIHRIDSVWLFGAQYADFISADSLFKNTQAGWVFVNANFT
ncbi:alginate export family protein [Acidithiobacillus ferrianus]|uniref:alginate export family protein n=1 Tax=Acidithiobacillus ferrianus TaxID=2678518 RepID=UPI0034E48E28